MVKNRYLILLITMLLVGCGTAKKPNTSSQQINPLVEQVQKDMNNERARKAPFVPLDEAIHRAKAEGDSCSKYHLAARYRSGSAEDTPPNCREAINWAKQSASLNIKKHPLNDPMDVGCAQSAASMLVDIYGLDGQCKDTTKFVQSKALLSKIVKESEQYEKRRADDYDKYAKKVGIETEKSKRDMEDQARLQSKKDQEQKLAWLRSITVGAHVCLKHKGSTQMPLNYLVAGRQAYGDPIPTTWVVRANFEERNTKNNKAKILVSKISAYLAEGGVQSIDKLDSTNVVYKVGNSVWVDDSELLPCS